MSGAKYKAIENTLLDMIFAKVKAKIHAKSYNDLLTKYFGINLADITV